MADLHMPHEKMSDFISIPLFGLTLITKLRNFEFETHRNTEMFFDKKIYDDRFE